MPTLFMIRHAESLANAQDVLGAQIDFPLSERGQEDAYVLARHFCAGNAVDRIVSSPLSRATATARAFAEHFGLNIDIDARLTEQDLGRFAGMTYAEAERDPGYRQDRNARWDWTPDGGGESYRDIAVRVGAFLADLQEESPAQRILLVTHAVTLRLFRAHLEATLPDYPKHIARNGEVWHCELTQPGTPHAVSVLDLGEQARAHYRYDPS